MSEKHKAIGLLSGGLDSSLALRIIYDLGIDVLAVHFHTGFCFADTRRAKRGDDKPVQGGPSDAFTAAERLGVPIEVVDVSDGYLQILHHPKYGYGRNVNPCIDCRIYLLDIARWMMEDRGADFVFSGEVLGQRPKSQQMMQLKLIARRSGLEDRLLRPLSARCLPPTLPEREGWVDRSRLFGFQGRTRKPQMALAAELGIEDYPQPAGGCCFLTDPAYGRKVKDLWGHRDKDLLGWDDYLLLKTGRHLRVSPELKVIVGRNEADNMFLAQYCRNKTRLEVEDFPGPLVILDAAPTDEHARIAAGIAGRYSDARDLDRELTVRVENGEEVRRIQAKPYKPEEVQKWVIS